ncbi:MAG: O-antigen ligase family protein [Planctomycetota bacterium]
MIPQNNAETESRESALSPWILLAGRWVPLLVAAFVLLHRPVVSGLVAEVGTLSVFVMFLLVAVFFWICHGFLQQNPLWKMGTGGLVGVGFLLWMGVSGAGGGNFFNAAKVWVLFASYGLTAFLVIHVVSNERRARFLLSCLLATGVVIALYAVFHRIFYIPALQRWIKRDPDYFRAVFEVSGPMFDTLVNRIRTGRAYGNFITPNQLASYLLLILFPLTGLFLGLYHSERGNRTRWWGAVTLLLVLAVLTALFLSGSKGGLVGGLAGGLILMLGFGWSRLKQLRWRIAGGIAVFALVFLAAQATGIMPGWDRFEASLGVRTHYWQVSGQMVADYPVRGIGTGSWEEHYTLRKQPEHEETRLAHNAFLQVWAENGTVGLFLLVCAVGVPLWSIWPRGGESGSSEERDWSAERHGEENDAFIYLGPLLALIGFGVDYFTGGNFRPPQTGAPPLLEAIPWLPYALLFVVWVVSFRSLFGALKDMRRSRFLEMGILAGLGAFLVHSTGEFTLRIPAIGGTAVGLGALLVVARSSDESARKLSLPLAGALLAVVFAVALGWTTLVMPRCLDYSLQKDRIFTKRGERGSADDPVEVRREIVGLYQDVVEDIPMDGEAWKELSRNQLMLAMTLRKGGGVQKSEVDSLVERALAAGRRAIELNPMKAEFYRNAGQILRFQERMRPAVEMFRQAAELHPSVPRTWLTYARTAEEMDGLSEEVCRAYRRASQLNVREVDASGKVVKGQYHERNVLEEEQKALVSRKVEECDEKDEKDGQ